MENKRTVRFTKILMKMSFDDFTMINFSSLLELEIVFFYVAAVKC